MKTVYLLFTFDSASERDRFAALYERYKRLALHKAYDILRDSALAEDAVSEAFIRVYKNMAKVGDVESPQTAAFIMVITRNAALSLLSSRKRVHVMEPDLETTNGYDLEDEALSHLEGERAYAAVQSMSEELRSVFVLKYAYDMSHRDIGAALGISENNVTVRLHRARQKLRVMLGEGVDSGGRATL